MLVTQSQFLEHFSSSAFSYDKCFAMENAKNFYIRYGPAYDFEHYVQEKTEWSSFLDVDKMMS